MERIAGEGLARAAPDGYTIGLVTASTHVIAHLINPNLTYHPLRDFTPVALISQSPYVLAVYPGLPAKSAKELIALAKSKPGEINNASFQAGSLGHLASALFAYRAGVTLNPVLYRSSAQAVMDAVAGRVEMQFSTLPPAIPLIREGKLRALATTGAKRVSVLSEVPTLAEDGMPGFDVSLWLGIAMAGQKSLRHCEAHQRRDDRHPQIAGCHRDVDRAGSGGGARPTGNARRHHQGGHRAMARLDRQSRDQGELRARENGRHEQFGCKNISLNLLLRRERQLGIHRQPKASRRGRMRSADHS